MWGAGVEFSWAGDRVIDRDGPTSTVGRFVDFPASGGAAFVTRQWGHLQRPVGQGTLETPGAVAAVPAAPLVLWAEGAAVISPSPPAVHGPLFNSNVSGCSP
jgi:hypothetical protein